MSNALGMLGPFARVGVDPADDEDQRLRKALLVAISVLILPISLMWGSLYLALGSPVGYVPYLYFGVSVVALIVFARTRNVRLLLWIELANILLAPTLSAIPLGGFIASSGVGLWGFLAPIGALVFIGATGGIEWFIAWLVVFLGSGIAGQPCRNGAPLPMPAWFTTTMLALNISVAGIVVFVLMVVFVAQRQDALAALRIEQDKAENLLLNVLPRTIAERLKPEPADHRRRLRGGHHSLRRPRRLHAFVDASSPTRSVRCSTRCSAPSTISPSATAWRRSRPSATRTWSSPACPTPRRSRSSDRRGWRSRMRGSAVQPTSELAIGLRAARSASTRGPVVAGVIGKQKFIYDLWGDAVNTASRMESHGAPGHIQVTNATHDLLERISCWSPVELSR